MVTEQNQKLEGHHDRIQAIPAKDLKLFNGKVVTIIYAPHPEGFKDYKIVRLTIDKNKVTDIEYLRAGTYYSKIEAGAWMETINSYLIDEMDRKYPAKADGESYRVA